MSRVGFIGLGNMGGPMAANLVRAGHAVSGYDLVVASLEAASRDGVAVAATPGAAVAEAEIVVTMLPSGGHVLQAYPGLLAASPAGTLFVDCSTIDVASARQAHSLAAAAGMESVDAPVSGGTAGAEAATLTFMAGGEASAVARATPVLSRMGRRVVPCGGPGAGQAAKICNNMVLGISMIGVSEAFVLGETLGLSHQALYDVLSTSSGQCWSVTTNCPVPGPMPASPANRDYRPGFMARLMLKDMRLASEAADSSGADIALGRQATALFDRFVESGGAERDFSAIIGDIRQRSTESTR